MEKRRSNNWLLVEKMFQNAIVVLVMAGIFFVVFILLTYAKAQYDAGQTIISVSNSLIMFFGFITAILTIVALVQLILAKILERR